MIPTQEPGKARILLGNTRSLMEEKPRTEASTNLRQPVSSQPAGLALEKVSKPAKLAPASATPACSASVEASRRSQGAAPSAAPKQSHTPIKVVVVRKMTSSFLPAPACPTLPGVSPALVVPAPGLHVHVLPPACSPLLDAPPAGAPSNVAGPGVDADANSNGSRSNTNISNDSINSDSKNSNSSSNNNSNLAPGLEASVPSSSATTPTLVSPSREGEATPTNTTSLFATAQHEAKNSSHAKLEQDSEEELETEVEEAEYEDEEIWEIQTYRIKSVLDSVDGSDSDGSEKQADCYNHAQLDLDSEEGLVADREEEDEDEESWEIQSYRIKSALSSVRSSDSNDGDASEQQDEADYNDHTQLELESEKELPAGGEEEDDDEESWEIQSYRIKSVLSSVDGGDAESEYEKAEFEGAGLRLDEDELTDDQEDEEYWKALAHKIRSANPAIDSDTDDAEEQDEEAAMSKRQRCSGNRISIGACGCFTFLRFLSLPSRRVRRGP